jgi:hypothetical protein
MEKTRFKRDAKQITDMLFDKRLFTDSLTRDDMNAFEDLIEFLLNSKFESHLRCEALLKSLEKNK